MQNLAFTGNDLDIRIDWACPRKKSGGLKSFSTGSMGKDSNFA
jgi:hypothetical protein